MELTEKEMDRIHRVNRRNGYGLSVRMSGDVHKMQLIEYRLTQINFHHECGLMARGKYTELAGELKAW